MDIITDLPIGEHYILIKLSGGADSSIIYYALCDKFKDRDDVKIIVITLDTDFKDQYISSAKRVINLVKKLTGKEPYDHLTNIVKHSNENYVNGQDALYEIANKKYPITMSYSGITRNPPHKEMVDFFNIKIKELNLNEEMVWEAINSRDVPRDNYTSTTRGRPFANFDKKATATAYNYYNMTDILYPMTFSCEAAPYKIDNNGMPIHCGECFFCLERWWGFGRLI